MVLFNYQTEGLADSPARNCRLRVCRKIKVAHSSTSAECTSRRAGERWLLLFNCQAQGLANSLTLLQTVASIECHDPSTFRANREKIEARLGSFDRIILMVSLEDRLGFDWSGLSNVIRVPRIYFSGYHPDLCYLSGVGPLAKGPLGQYHSAIAYAAFRAGLDEAQAAKLYRDENYQSLGYFDTWGTAREEMIRSFARCGLNIESDFLRWCRSGPFMHTVNHPKIEVLLDLARVILRHLDIDVRESGIIPQDNLANGPAFAVYPGIGARYGVHGSLLFKQGADYSLIDLHEFIARSFAVYRAAGTAEPSIPAYFGVVERARALIERSALTAGTQTCQTLTMP